MTTTDIQSPCPYCGKLLDRATGAEGKSPKAGAITVCLYCYKVSSFDKKLRMQKFDLNRLDPASRMKVEALIRTMRARLKPN
jgi:hypothetical protein